MMIINTDNLAFQLKYMMVKVTAIALLIVFITFLLFNGYDYRETLKDHGLTLSDIMVLNLSPTLISNDKENAEKVLGRINADKSINTAVLFDQHGENFAVYSKKTVEFKENFEEVKAPHNNPGNKRTFLFLADGIEVLTPVVHADEVVGLLYIRLSLEQFCLNNMMIFLLLFIIIMLGVVWLSGRLQKQISVPIERLLNGILKVKQDKNYNFQIEYEATNFSEIKQLTDGFNDLLAQVSDRESKLQNDQQNKQKESIPQPLSEKDSVESFVIKNTRHDHVSKVEPSISDDLCQHHVLLVEDNPVNQKLAKAMLSKFSVQVSTADNGEQALELMKNTTYGLVLMDCHMPKMNGFEATRQYRLWEQNGHHMPIVALTADVVEGIQEECRNAGMDDYVSKPFLMADLQNVINKWLEPLDSAAEESMDNGLTAVDDVPQKIEETEYLDMARLKPIIELQSQGRPDLLLTVIEIYLTDSLKHNDVIHQSFEQADSEALFKACHSLKSSSANLGAQELSDVCKVMEKAGRDADLETISQKLSEYDSAFDKTREAVLALQKQYQMKS